jgi:hypothetical protein
MNSPNPPEFGRPQLVVVTIRTRREASAARAATLSTWLNDKGTVANPPMDRLRREDVRGSGSHAAAELRADGSLTLTISDEGDTCTSDAISDTFLIQVLT